MASFGIYQDDEGEHRWRLTSGNGIIADSGEGYGSEDGARDAIERVREDAAEADILDTGEPHFELYEDRSGEWRWRMIAGNGRIVADSAEGYSDKSGAKRAIENVQSRAQDTEVTEA